jgi:hypothetical protein
MPLYVTLGKYTSEAMKNINEVSERLQQNTRPQLRPLIAKTYAGWDMTTASQAFHRQLTPELLRALSGTT